MIQKIVFTQIISGIFLFLFAKILENETLADIKISTHQDPWDGQSWWFKLFATTSIILILTLPITIIFWIWHG